MPGEFGLRDIRSVPASSVRNLSLQWVGRLAPYRLHRNDEHREALIEEALRYTGLHLENDLSGSDYWSKWPLARRVAVLLFLVDRGVVVRGVRQGVGCSNPSPTPRPGSAPSPPSPPTWRQRWNCSPPCVGNSHLDVTPPGHEPTTCPLAYVLDDEGSGVIA